jgi:hypothetical protein
MDQGKFTLHQRLRKRTQVGKVVRRQLLAVLEVRQAGIAVETIEIQPAHSGPVMVARDAEMRKGSQKLDTFVGIWTITNHVSQTPDLVNGSGSLQHGLECLQVAMDIRDHKIPHRISSKSGIAQRSKRGP